MATLLENLKKAVSLADQALALILYDENEASPLPTLKGFTDLVIKFSDTLLLDYEQYIQVLLENGNLESAYDENWLKSAIERINLAVFTAALWNEHPDLDALGDEYFSTVIPEDIEFSDAIINAYFDVQARLLLGDIQAALDATNGEEIEAGQLYSSRLGPRRIEYYGIPPHKGGMEKILMESERKFNQFMDMDLDQFEQDVTHERLQETWRRALLDIETQLQTSSDDDHACNNDVQQGNSDGDRVSQEWVTSLNMDDNDPAEGEKDGANSNSGDNAARLPLSKPKLTGIQLALAMEDAEDAAKEYFREAAKNVTKKTIIHDFKNAPEAPAFLVDIVRPYLLKLVSEHTDEDLIDAACDAAASYRDELQINMKLPVQRSGPLSADAFRYLLAPHDLIPSNALDKLSPMLSSTDSPSELQTASKPAEHTNPQESTTLRNSVRIENFQESWHTGDKEPEIPKNMQFVERLQETYDTMVPRVNEAVPEEEELSVTPPMDQGDEMPQPNVMNQGPALSTMESAMDAADSSSDEFAGASSHSVATAWHKLSDRRDVQTTWPPRRPGFRQVREERTEKEIPDEHEQDQQDIPVPSTTETSPPPKRQKTSKLRRIYKPWTDEELDALSEGMRTIGPQWAQIKREYSDALQARSNIDIKDKVRNIVKQKQADGEPLEYWQISRHG